ncbi:MULTISPECIES: SurA N-terminal domain-containing protein [unclassified Oceanobacter]|uniref:SurA N-terminal domain-containing protein n=1 Tax=unclassified Oceanobacter TaxID=2620260 RepID=UPI002736467A|nr:MULTISPECIES: SurA N-terminal domain-containing protein [unclassified Oceanobacter]MDP2546704.1 SurA N-terminal domain-containing protein [Oceanobacter sp. 4_MG-2023]MDP2608556.1 SurA N-terminal domain-containing protein [Oceanobacter sp. 1_MG-2023]MDP2611682.1 SurA N-terminal domain-containing protein [Oceanobacter sp. 2_MG-2023]
MLQTMRNSAQGIIAKVIVFFIILVFALWGVEGIVNIGSGETPVAEVGGVEILEPDIQRLIEQQKANLRRQFGEQFDENLFNDQLLRESALDQLIQQRVDAVQADRFGLYASTSVVDQAIVNIPAFQLDGRFNKEQFLSVLRMNGWTPLTFRASLGEDLKVNQAQQALTMTSIPTPYQTRLSAMLNGELRTVSYVEIRAQDLMDDIELSDEDVQTYYDDNSSRFQSPEQARIRYVGFDRAALAAAEEVSEDEIKAAYDDYLNELSAKEQRSSRHILVEVSDERSSEEALAKANELKAELDAGADFAELAQTSSDDIASGSSGGDLGYISHGTFVPEFETALFAMQQGDISEPVKTEFGYHIIQLLDVKASESDTFEQQHDELAEYIRNEKAGLRIAEQTQELSNLAFSSDSVDEIAAVLGLTVQESGLFTRDFGEGLAANDAVRQQAFAENLLLDRELSELVETEQGVYVFAVSEHEEPRTLPLEIVRQQVENLLKRDRASELADTIAAQIAAGEQESDAWTSVEVTYDQTTDLPREAQSRAFALQQGVVAVVDVQGGAAVVRVDDIQVDDLADLTVSAEEKGLLENRAARANIASYRKWAQDNIEIKRPGA